MIYVFGDCELDVQRRVMYRAGQVIRLRRKVFQTLTYLLTSHDRAISKEELRQAVWPQLFVSDAALESTVRAVRRAIGESGRAPALLQTVHGYGYRFVAAVEERADIQADPASEHVTSPPVAEAGGALPRHQSTSDGSTVVEREAQVTGWEQKPVVVLAINLTFPRSTGFGIASDEPWTVVSRWAQAIVEKVQGFGGVLMQHSPSLLMMVFGIPRALDQMPQRAVQAALAIQILVAEARSARGEEPCPEVRMAVHLGAVHIDAQAGNPMDRLLAVGDTLSSPIQLLGHAVSGELLVSPQIGRLVEGQFALLAREVPPSAGQADPVGAYSVVGLTRRRSPSAGRGDEPRRRDQPRGDQAPHLRDTAADEPTWQSAAAPDRRHRERALDRQDLGRLSHAAGRKPGWRANPAAPDLPSRVSAPLDREVLSVPTDSAAAHPPGQSQYRAAGPADGAAPRAPHTDDPRQGGRQSLLPGRAGLGDAAPRGPALGHHDPGHDPGGAHGAYRPA